MSGRQAGAGLLSERKPKRRLPLPALHRQDPDPSFFADASASGRDAFIFTRSRLVGQDQDELHDVYDVRAGGGSGSQNPPPPNRLRR